jgi:two-component system OmpR family response regulator
MNLIRPFSRWTSRRASSDRFPRKILVVDDDRASADALAAALASEGHDIRYAYNAVGAFGQIDDWVPAIVLLDISMPEHDGFAMARMLRRFASTRNVVVIAVTALMEDYVRAHRSSGSLDGYFQKGTSITALLALLQALSDG